MHIIYSGGDKMDRKKQTRITVSFRENEKEQELYDWIISKSDVIGEANAVKQILYEKMLEENKK